MGEVASQVPREDQGIDRLLEIVPRALSQRLHGVIDAAMPGDHVEGTVGMPAQIVGKQLEPCPVLELQIGEHRIRCGLRQFEARLAHTADTTDLGAESFQHPRHAADHARIVIDHQQGQAVEAW